MTRVTGISARTHNPARQGVWSTIGLVVLVGALATHLSDAQAPPPGSGRTVVTRYVRIIDGDTVEVEIQGIRVGAGILGILAPMGNTPCGRESTAALAALVQDGVVLEEDPRIGLERSYRRMYYARTLEGASIAVALSEAGVVQGDSRGAEAGEIAAAVERARASRTGCVWAQ